MHLLQVADVKNSDNHSVFICNKCGYSDHPDLYKIIVILPELR